MPHENTHWIVRVQYDTREQGHDYGPFAARKAAEACLIRLAGRTDVKTATLIEETA